MAYFRKRFGSKRTFRRRSSFRKRYSYRKKRNINQYSRKITRMTVRPMVMADKTFVKLTRNFSNVINITDTHNYASLNIGGNGFLDSVSTHAPAGLSQWAVFYRNYRIMSASIKVIAYPGGNMSSDGVIFGVTPYLDGAKDFTRANAPSQPYTKWRVGSDTNPTIIKHVMNTKKMFGQRITEEENFQGNMSYDPTTDSIAVLDPNTQWFFKVWGSRPGASGNFPLQFYFTVTYYIQLEDRITADDATIIAQP